MIPPLRSKEQYDFMKSKEEPSYIVENVISQKDIDYIYNTWKETRAKREYPAGYGGVGKKEKKKKGALKFPYAWKEFEHILTPIVDGILKTSDWRFITGRLYYVSKERTWDTIHNDNWNYLKKIYPDGPDTNNGPSQINWIKENSDKIYMARKTIVLPLWYNAPVNTVMFNQHNYGVESVSWNRHKHREDFPGPLTSYTEYLEPLDKDTISDDDYEKYLAHCDRDLLKGLSIQKVQNWKLGNALVWDATQLHVSGYQSTNIEKVGITIWTAYS